MAPDNKIIETVFTEEKSRLFNFIRKNVLLEEDAEDILHDVFYRFIEQFSEIEVIERISSWLYTTARNRIIDKSRKGKTKSFSDIEMSYQDEEDDFYFTDILKDEEDLPADLLERSETMSAINEFLDELPKAQKEVFVLNEIEGYSFKEISSKLNVPVNTLLSRKRYAVNYLKKRLQNLYEENKYEI